MDSRKSEFKDHIIKLAEISENSDGISEDELQELSSFLKNKFKEENSELSDSTASLGAEVVAKTMASIITGKKIELAPLKSLTDEEITTLNGQVKKILEEEKIPAEKHDAFVKYLIEKIQDDIQVINNLTVEKVESGELNSLNWMEKLLEIIDYKIESREGNHLIQKLQELELVKRNILYSIDKSINLAIEKEERNNKILQNFFEAMGDSFNSVENDSQEEQEENQSQLGRRLG